MAANDKSGFWNDWKTKHPRWHRLLVLELACVLGLLIGLIWLLGADIWLFWSENRDNVRDLGLFLAAVIGLPLLIWREITGHRTANIAAERHEKQTEADRERRITDSFTKAVELLGKPELEVRLGAIYALERIASESKRDHWPIMETLTAYVRTRSPASTEVQDASRSNQTQSPDKEASAYAVAAAEGTTEAAQGTLQHSSTPLAADIQATLTVLGRRTAEHEEESHRINLISANLSGALLSGAFLSGADLSEVNLSGTILSGADLSGVNLTRGFLSGAFLSGADLSGAFLNEADLSGADLSGAFLSGADLVEANLRGAFLSGADLRGAFLNEADLSGALLENAKFCRTTMPDGTVNNRDCPPEPIPPTSGETPPTPD